MGRGGDAYYASLRLRDVIESFARKPPVDVPSPPQKTKIRRGLCPRRIVLAAGSCPAVVITACADDYYFLMTFAVLTVLPSALTTLTM